MSDFIILKATDDKQIEIPTLNQTYSGNELRHLLHALIEHDGYLNSVQRLGIDREVVEALRNEPVAKHLSTLLESEVKSIPFCVGPEAQAATEALQPGEILMLENVRFHAEEEANVDEFSRQLASLADVYVSDAFGTAHRAHASVVGVPKYIPGVAGLLMEREVDYLTRVTDDPQRPFGLILGG